MKVDGYIEEDVTTNNVIAETPGGRADRTVVVGGHLDSVYDGPGINDDGSGVSMMLETAEEMHEPPITPRNKVRFIFFSGEEQGLLGSDHYVSQLTKKQIQDISVMLDFDMLASPNYARFIYDGNGDEHGFAGPTAPAPSSRYSRTSGTAKAWRTRPSRSTGGRTMTPSPRRVFRQAASLLAPRESSSRTKSPLYGGTAGVAFDRCYHRLCDDLSNINNQGLAEHSDAANSRDSHFRGDDIVGKRDGPANERVRGEGVEGPPPGALTDTKGLSPSISGRGQIRWRLSGRALLTSP